MTFATVDIRVTNDRRTIQALRGWARALEDWRPVWALVEADFYRMETEQFSSQGSRGGSRWPALSPRYAAWKSRHYPGQPLMVRTGKLRDSLTHEGGEGQVRVIDSGRMELGTDVEYAPYHQAGGPDLPQRKVIEVTDQDVARWAAFAEQRAIEAARKAGLA